MTEPADRLPDTLVVDGTRLYAPIVACRPIDPSQYPLIRRRAWAMAVDKLGGEPEVYEGSAADLCSHCGVGVWVGPRQAERLTLLDEVGLRRIVVCFICAPGVIAKVDAQRLMFEKGTLPEER
jgi:hypothetical protein